MSRSPAEGDADVMVLTNHPIEILGGAESFLRYLVAGLGERGYRVAVHHYENSAPRFARGWTQAGRLKRELVASLSPIVVGHAANRAMRRKPRLILSSGPVGSWPTPRGVPHVHFAHGTLAGQTEAIRAVVSAPGYWKAKLWNAHVIERSAGRGKPVLACSDFTAAEIERIYGQPAVGMWYPLDLRHFRPRDRGEARRELGLDPHKPVGLFVGNSHPMKGLPMVEKMIRAHPQAQWLVALRGDVPLRTASWPNTRVIKDAPFDLLPTLYSAADVSLCPSLYEPFGFVVAEALACGAPVVASPGGAASRFLRGGLAGDLLVPSATDEEGFRRAVSKVLADPGAFRGYVEKEVRPHVEELMAPESWWPRFLEAVGLPEKADL